MANFNKVILAGNLTRDPQLSTLPSSNTSVCETGMAVNRKWRGQDGDAREEVCFVDLRAFGKTAELMSDYLQKGSPALIEGRLKLDQWEAKDGSGKRSKLYVVVDSVQFLGGRDDGGGKSGGRAGGQSSGYGGESRGGGRRNQREDDTPPFNRYDADNPDDVPF